MINKWNRREFLQKTSAATLAAMTASAPVASLLSGCTSGDKSKSKLVGQRGTADTVILIWMAGGMAHTETFDPKRFTPYDHGDGRQPGAEYVQIGADGAGRYSFFRWAAIHWQGNGPGYAHSVLRSGRHGAHSALAPPVSLAHLLRTAPNGSRSAHRGSWIAKELGPKNPVIPAFIDIGQRFTRGRSRRVESVPYIRFSGQ